MSSSFSFPDGDVLGTADFPSQPWISAGGLEIDGGRLTGLGEATVGQGGAFSYDGVRVRFRARFSDSGQSASVAFNGAGNDTIGLYVTLDSSGSLRLSEGEELMGEQNLAPLDTGVDWFVESVLVGTSAEVTVARGNYASEVQSDVAKSLEVSGLKASASGIKTLVKLGGRGALAPSVDELSVDRCGLAPPQYEVLFSDAFERPDGSALGSPDVPSDAQWFAAAVGNTEIVDGALEITNNGQVTAPLKTVPGDGLRIRTTVSTITTTDVFWADVNYNGTSSPDAAISGEPGFYVWATDSSNAYSSIFGGSGQEVKHAGRSLTVGTDYFVELNRDDGAAVLTVRTGSFDGPISFVEGDNGFTAADNKGQFIRLSTQSAVSTTRFDDIHVERYVAP